MATKHVLEVLVPRQGLATKLEQFLEKSQSGNSVRMQFSTYEKPGEVGLSSHGSLLRHVQRFEERGLMAHVRHSLQEENNFYKTGKGTFGTDIPESLTFFLDVAASDHPDFSLTLNSRKNHFKFRYLHRLVHIEIAPGGTGMQPAQLETTLALLECLQPYFGFFEPDWTVTPRHHLMEARRELGKLRYRLHYARAPWMYHHRTLLFGPELTQKIGLERLLSAPAPHVQQLAGPMVIFWGRYGILNVPEFPYGDVEEEAEERSDEQIRQHLGLKELRPYLDEWKELFDG